ncbi:MAG: S41 family peptidase, partial [Paraclostridium sp.]
KFFINSYDVLSFFNVVDNTNANFTFKNDKGEEINLNLKAVENKKINYISSNRKEMKTNIIEGIENPYYWYKNFNEDNILYFRYNAFLNNYYLYKDTVLYDILPDFREVQESLIAEINKKNYSKFIIDLRENGGGDNNILNAMISMFKFQTDLKGEEIYVIIGKETFSASVVLAWELESKIGATVVGETTGGNVNLFTTVSQKIELPNSNLKITHPFKESTYDKNHTGGAVPDYEVIQTYEDYINGIDTCYEFIKNIDKDK